jgi:REP element-mobilizing transposase RayT
VCNNKERLLGASDFKMYLDHLDNMKKELKFKLYDYSLLPNHIHLIIQCAEEFPINEVMFNINGRFSKIYNYVHKRKGHLWLDRYYSVLIRTDVQLLCCMRYVGRNAYVAGYVQEPIQWKWCGVRHFASDEENKLLDEHEVYLDLSKDPNKRCKNYLELVNTPIPTDKLPKPLVKWAASYLSST